MRIFREFSAVVTDESCHMCKKMCVKESVFVQCNSQGALIGELEHND